MAQLHNPLRARDTTQLMRAQNGQPTVGREPVSHQVLGAAGQQRLATVPQVAKACRAVDRRSGVVAFVAQLDLTGVHADAQSDRCQRGALYLQRHCHRIRGAGECRDEAVTFALFDRAHPVVGGDDSRHYLIEPSQRSIHFVGLGLP